MGPVINVKEKFGLFQEQWQPKVIAQINDYHFKVAKIEGEFVWHDHPETDEAFFVVEGELRIELPDGHVDLSAGELFVVPKGIKHRPVAKGEVKLMLIEPKGTVNTGEEGGDRTAELDVWI